MKKSDKEKILQAIYYLKLDELDKLSKTLNLKAEKQKTQKISSILNFLKIKPTAKNVIVQQKFTKYKGKLSPDKYILPGHYTNGVKSRLKFKELIGEHFKFTNYGMQWIRNEWRSKRYPTYVQFSKFWQSEFESRKNGKQFESLQTNARVRFFRDNKGLTKEQLSKAWQAERNKQKKILFKTLEKLSITN